MVDQVPVTFVDNPHAPEVFAFQVTGIAFFAGNIHLTFEAPRVDHKSSPGPVNRVVVGRLVMPLAGAEGLRDLLTDWLAKQKAGQTEPQRQTRVRFTNQALSASCVFGLSRAGLAV